MIDLDGSEEWKTRTRLSRFSGSRHLDTLVRQVEILRPGFLERAVLRRREHAGGMKRR